MITRLFDHLGVKRFQALDHSDCRKRIPGFVWIEAQTDIRTHRCADLSYYLKIKFVTATHLAVNRAMTLLHQSHGILGEIPRFRALNKPKILNVLPLCAAQQFINWPIKCFSLKIPERHFQPGQHLPTKARCAAVSTKLKQRLITKRHQSFPIKDRLAQQMSRRLFDKGLNALCCGCCQTLPKPHGSVFRADLDQ